MTISLHTFNNPISFRKASYVAGIAIGIGCLGPITITGYFGAAAAGLMTTLAIDVLREIGKAAITPFYTKRTHRIAPPLSFSDPMDLDEAISRIPEHPVYLSLKEKKIINENIYSFLKPYDEQRKGEEIITELLQLTDNDPHKSWTTQCESMNVKNIIYNRLLHALKLETDKRHAILILKSSKLMYSAGSESTQKEIADKQSEIKEISVLSNKLARELYPFKVVDGLWFRKGFKVAFEKLASSLPEKVCIKGRLTILTAKDLNFDQGIALNKWPGVFGNTKVLMNS